MRTSGEVDVPRSSRVDTARALIAAIAELDPTGISSTGVGLLNVFLPTALERRTRDFHEQVAGRIASLTTTTLDLRSELDERLAVAALAQGTLSAARSASEEHLGYLANATARAFSTTDERSADHAMLLLRLAGDISATHLRLLDMYADPHAYARRTGKRFEWTRDDHGQYPLIQVPAVLDPQLAADHSFVNALFRDLEKLGLVGDDDPMSRIEDGGSVDNPPPDEVTRLGLELLAFVAEPAEKNVI